MIRQGNGWILTQQMLETITCKSFLPAYEKVCADGKGTEFITDSAYRKSVFEGIASGAYEERFPGKTFSWDEDLEIIIRKYPDTDDPQNDPIGVLFGPGEIVLSWSDDDKHRLGTCAGTFTAAQAVMEPVKDLLESAPLGHYLTGRLVADILKAYREHVCKHLDEMLARYHAAHPEALEKLIRFMLRAQNQKFPKNVQIEVIDDLDAGGPNVSRFYEIELKPGEKGQMHTWIIRLPALVCPVYRVFPGPPDDPSSGPGCYPPCGK